MKDVEVVSSVQPYCAELGHIEMTASQWNAYVAAGKTPEQRRERLAQVPEDMRAGVEAHVRTVFAIRRKTNRAR